MNREKTDMLRPMKRGLAAAAAVGLFLLQSPLCAAQVITTTELTGPADCVYIAGNPDMYPIEYYDKALERYCGVLPDLLEQVAQDTGISFAYVYAQKTDERQELVRNSQVEMVTAFRQGEFNRTVLPVQEAVLTAPLDGRDTWVYLGFTAVADAALRDKIIESLRSIPEEKKTAVAISYAMQQADGTDLAWKTAAIAVGVVLAAAAVLGILLRRKSDKELKAALTDHLTGQGNVQYYINVFREISSGEQKPLYYVGYLFWGDNGAKELLSHEEYVEVQQKTAQYICGRMGVDEYICRLAAGAFALVFHCSSREEAADRMGEMMSSLRERLGELRPEYAVLFRCGVCPLEENPDTDAENALHLARYAWRQALKTDSLFAFSTHELKDKTRSDEKLRYGIDNALKNGEIKPYLQFITDCRTGKICGAEALSRWEHPTLGIVKPGMYIELMKQTGTIAKHDEYMFEKLCALLSAWEGTERGGLFLTCNFTRVSISQKDFADRIGAIADRYRFDRSRLVLEITEDSLTQNSAQATNNIGLCKQMGFGIAIDDMGSGFSAISDLYSNEIDMVKVERDIVQNAMTEKGRRLLDGIIALAHNMKATVLCEGIENAEQHKMILTTGCDMVQGFYYSRALPVAEATRFLQSRGQEMQ